MEDILVNPSRGSTKFSSVLPARIITVKELLSIPNLRLPHYQRPYKWTARHVHQLIDDVLLFKAKSAYRLGTLVLHEHHKGDEEAKETWLDIVDGQQRSVTIMLIAQAIYNERKGELTKLNKTDDISSYEPNLDLFHFRSSISQQNIVQNYAEISRRVLDFDTNIIRFFYEQCQLVQVTIRDVSEAFQFFDSQNARGKDLEPHDLLKAYHLREMSGVPEEERIACISQWEELRTEELSALFADYLFPVRRWAKGHSARYFSKSDVDVFKGISPQPVPGTPYSEMHRLTHYYVDGYNRHEHRDMDGRRLEFPFQLDGTLLNGRRFFEFVNHYLHLSKSIRSEGPKNEAQQGLAATTQKIISLLNSYPSRYRTGDGYVRRLFDCCLLYYTDRFGKVETDRAIALFFIWAYSLRLNSYAVQLASIDNQALGKDTVPMFRKIHNALHPNDVLNTALPAVKEIQGTKLEEIAELFRKLKYYDGQ